jgi:hypothetical protein
MNRVKTLCRNTTIILVVLSSTIVLAQKETKTEFNKFVDNYYEEGLLFNPIAATKRRQQVQRFIAKRYCCTVPKKTRLHHKISKLLKAFDNKSIPLIKLLSIS